VRSPRQIAKDNQDWIRSLSKAALDVIAEHHRQVEVEGWTPEHDDMHTGGQLAQAAICYADPRNLQLGDAPPSWWPWSRSWWKPKDSRRDLIKAAALIVAEIERLDRLSAPMEQEPSG
jgi:hypothetical protein